MFRLAISVILLCSTILVGGCASADNQASRHDVKTTKTIERIRACTSTPFEPAEFEENGELVGYDIDIMSEIGSELGAKVEWQIVEFDDLLSSVKKAECDVAIASLEITEKRKESVEFIPYIMGPNKPSPNSERKLGIAVNPHNVELHSNISQAVDTIYSDGSMKAILSQWDAEDHLISHS